MSVTPSELASASIRGLADQCDAFQPSWMLRNGHVQTLGGAYLIRRRFDRDSFPVTTATRGEVLLDDGDRLVFHDDCPADWRPGNRVALLLHGLSGNHDSPYMRRVASQLYLQNVRTIRLDWRGSGAGMSLARYPYHSGRTEDVKATLDVLRFRCPNSPICLIGFSLGGNVALKLLGEAGAMDRSTAGIARAVAICPPIDLSAAVENLRTGWARWYDSYFAKACIRDVRRRQQLRPDAIVPDGWFKRLPRTMREFDESFTAPVCGFASAAAYYARCSAGQFLPTIAVPTLIIAAQDDPVVPYGPFADATFSSATQLRAPKHGGHMGFVSIAGPSWLDRQIIDWTVGGDQR